MGQLEQRQRSEQPSGCARRPETAVETLRTRPRAGTWTLTPGQELASTARAGTVSPGVGRCQPRSQAGEKRPAVWRDPSGHSEEVGCEEEKTRRWKTTEEDVLMQARDENPETRRQQYHQHLLDEGQRLQVRMTRGSCLKSRDEQWWYPVKEHRSGCR